MRNIKKMLLLLALLVVLPTRLKAYTCSNADIVRLQKLASNIKYSYDDYTYFDEEYQININAFNVTLTNLTDELYGYDELTDEFFRYGENEENPSILTKGTFAEGLRTQIKIYASDKTGACADRHLTQLYVTFPYMNPFYGHEECKGIEDFDLCQNGMHQNLLKIIF